jgi:hypothetical protein
MPEKTATQEAHDALMAMILDPERPLAVHSEKLFTQAVRATQRLREEGLAVLPAWADPLDECQAGSAELRGADRPERIADFVLHVSGRDARLVPTTRPAREWLASHLPEGCDGSEVHTGAEIAAIMVLMTRLGAAGFTIQEAG